MTRRPWTTAEIEDIVLGWERFHSLHPERTYDSFEVKRRRVPGGTAGTNARYERAHVRQVRRVRRALQTIAEFAGVEL